MLLVLLGPVAHSSSELRFGSGSAERRPEHPNSSRWSTIAAHLLHKFIWILDILCTFARNNLDNILDHGALEICTWYLACSQCGWAICASEFNLHHDRWRLTFLGYENLFASSFSAYFFSRNNVFLSQQISRNSVLVCFFSEANGAITVITHLSNVHGPYMIRFMIWLKYYWALNWLDLYLEIPHV